MANYNHEILVNYLRDVYSMELLVRKIEDDIHSTREDIQCEQALVEKVESTPIPAEGNISPKKDITPYMIAGFLIMVYGMIVYNVALNTGGVTNATFGMALHEMPIMVPVAFVLEFFVVEKLATALAFTFMRPTDRPQFITYAISLMIVCIMCPVMSLVATLLFKEPSFGTWVHTWGCNFPMALCWQMFYCGPLSRFIFRAIFRKQLQAENQEQH